MAHKSRGSYRIGLCLREDCIYRDLLCHQCLGFDKYMNTEMAKEQGGGNYPDHRKDNFK